MSNYFNPQDEAGKKRCKEPPEGEESIDAIEINFAIPVYISSHHFRVLSNFLDELLRVPENQLAEGMHWASGCGAKPSYSQADQRFLNMSVDPTAPEKGEPTYDSSILHFDTTARPCINEEERAKQRSRVIVTPIGKVRTSPRPQKDKK